MEWLWKLFSGKDIIVILNDNEMSISKNIGGMNRLLTKLRVKRNYTKSNDFWKTHIGKIPIIGRPTTKSVGRVKNSLKQLIIPSMYFEDIGFRYLGPVDGHNISDMEDLFSKAKELHGPTLIHVLTKKGKGYNLLRKLLRSFMVYQLLILKQENLLRKKRMIIQKYSEESLFL